MKTSVKNSSSFKGDFLRGDGCHSDYTNGTLQIYPFFNELNEMQIFLRMLER